MQPESKRQRRAKKNPKGDDVTDEIHEGVPFNSARTTC